MNRRATPTITALIFTVLFICIERGGAVASAVTFIIPRWQQQNQASAEGLKASLPVTAGEGFGYSQSHEQQAGFTVQSSYHVSGAATGGRLSAIQSSTIPISALPTNADIDTWLDSYTPDLAKDGWQIFQAKKDRETEKKFKEVAQQLQIPPASCDVPKELYIPTGTASKPIPTPKPGHSAHGKLIDRMSNQNIYSELAQELGTFVDDNYLQDLAIEYNQRARVVGVQDEYGKVLRDRAQACHLAAEYPRVKAHSAAASMPSSGFLENFPELELFRKFEGNFAQYRLYQESAFHVATACKQFRDYALVDTISAITPLVFNLSTAAMVQENPEVAFSLSDTCFHLLKANELMQSLVGAFDTLANLHGQVSFGIQKGTEIFLKNAVHYLKQLATSPKQTLKGTINNLCEAAKNALGLAIVLSAQTDNPFIRQRQYELIDQAKNSLKQAYRDPERAAAVVTEMLLEQAVFCGLIKAGSVGLKTLGGALKRAENINYVLHDLRMAHLRIKNPQYAATVAADVGCYEPYLQSMLLQDADLMTAAEKMLSPVEQGKLLAQGCSEQVSRQIVHDQVLINPVASTVTGAVEQIATKYDLIYAEARKVFAQKAPKRSVKHLKGEVTTNQKGKRKLTGLHMTIDQPGVILEDLGTIDSFGSRALKVSKGGCVKNYTTKFPDSWNLNKIYNSVGEAWLNPIAGTVRDGGCIGMTSEGMLIETWLDSSPSSGEFFIKSAYPVSKNHLAEIINTLKQK